MKTTSVIRNRGQLTIPDSIRKMITWATPMSAVTISIEKPDEITIRPHEQRLDFNEIWENIHKSRSIKGGNKVSALQILENDREGH